MISKKQNMLSAPWWRSPARANSMMIGEVAAAGAYSPEIPRANPARTEAPRHRHEQARQAWRLRAADAGDQITFGQVLADSRRPPRAVALPEPYRLPALRRLPHRGRLRDQACFCQSDDLRPRGPRSHHHRRRYQRGRGRSGSGGPHCPSLNVPFSSKSGSSNPCRETIFPRRSFFAIAALYPWGKIGMVPP